MAGGWVLPRLTYPIPEETGSSLLLLTGQITGIAFILTLDKLIPMSNCTTRASPAAILIWSAIGLAVIALALYQGEYNRLRNEAGGNKSHHGLAASDSEDEVIPVTVTDSVNNSAAV